MTTNHGSGSRPTRRAYLRHLAGASALALAGCGRTADPALEVPDESRLDVATPPVATGISTDRATMTAETELTTRAGMYVWRSRATFAVDDGRIDPADRAPLEGSYESADPMGLFWSMEPDAEASTVVFPMGSHEVTLSVREPDATEPLAIATTRRVVPDRDSEFLSGDLVGTVYLPPGDGPAPGVLLLHGSGGEELTNRAQLLAARGYVAATLDYFGGSTAVPRDLVEVPVEYVRRAVEQLAGHSRVAGDRIGLYGVSKGAELALLVGSVDDRVGAVASVAGSGVVWAGASGPYGSRVADASSWSRNGEPVPYLPIPRDTYADGRAAFAAGYEAATRVEREAAIIPVERIDGPVLFVSGRDDGIWNSVAYSNVARDRLRRNDHPYPVEHLVYEDAGHAIRPPYLPTYGLSQAGQIRYGGTPAGNARAAADHWPRILSTFAEALG